MSNYKEETQEGSITKWTRARKISISNEYNKTPEIYFEEEEKEILPDGAEMSRKKGGVAFKVDMSETVDLLNPADNSVIGSFTLQDMQLMLYSLYIKKADERDNPVIEPTEQESIDAALAEAQNA